MSGFTFGASQPASNQLNVGFNFGSTSNQSSAAAGGGGGTFGAVAATTSGTTFGTGSSLFSFSSSTTTTTASTGLFGSSSAPSLGQSGFSFNPAATSTTTGSTLSFQPNSTGSGFGTSFLSNKPAQPTLGFGGGSLFQTNQQQQQQQQQLQQQQQQQQQNPPISSLFAPKIYNDERDNIIGLFNSIQAFWGTGKAYYSAFQSPYEFNESDQFNRFKTICYSEVQNEDKNNENKVFFLLKLTTDESQLKTNLLTYEQNFKQIAGNYTVKLELKNILPDSKAIVTMEVIDNATSKYITEAQLRNHFSQPNAKQQLNNVFGGNFLEVLFLSLSKQELDAYLSAPPKGIDERLWIQAKLENPDPTRFTPLPLIGFSALNNRFKMQEKEIQQQQMRLKQIIDNVTALESDISQFKAKFDDCRRKHASLSYQVLKKMIYLEVHRKRTLPIQAEEDKLRASLEAIQSELNVPTKFQGCLNELMSQLRQMQCQSQLTNTITLDKTNFNEYKQLLMAENEGIMNLVAVLKKDLEDINRLTSVK